MSLIQTFFDISSWSLFAYIILTIIICIISWKAGRENLKLRGKTEKWITGINLIFVMWFVLFTIFGLQDAYRMNKDLGFEPLIDAEMWVMALSAGLFIFFIYNNKIRKSPYTMVGISVIIIINFLIAWSNVAIIV
jgi:hypothetical protein